MSQAEIPPRKLSPAVSPRSAILSVGSAVCAHLYSGPSWPRVDPMKRREFIMLLFGATLASVSRNSDAVVARLSLIWELGMEP
jgi:hypothetical protein